MQATEALRTPTRKISSETDVEEYRASVRAAAESLTPAQLARLQTFAKWRSKMLGKKAAGRDWEDLLSEAITAILERRRAWIRERGDFFAFLVWAMKSISASWYAQKNEEYGESDWPTEVFDGDEVAPTLERYRADDANPERLALAEDLLRRFRETLYGDEDAIRVFDLLTLGMTAKEITEQLQISFNSYEATTKRLRRRLKRTVMAPLPGRIDRKAP